MKVTGYLLATALVLTGTVATALGQDNTGGQEYDPEHGVARISVIAGDVSIQRGDSDERSAAAVNAFIGSAIVLTVRSIEVSVGQAVFMSGTESAFLRELLFAATAPRFADAAKSAGPFASGSGGNGL